MNTIVFTGGEELPVAMPTRPGYYWARWVKAAPGTADGGEGAMSQWELVQVYENCLDPSHPEYLMVFVHGVAKPQRRLDFIWGNELDTRPPYDLSADH